MRWRGGVVDVFLAVCGVVLDVLVTWGHWGGPAAPFWIAGLFSLLAGLPLGLVRRWPGPVAVHLAVLLVVCDQLGANTTDTVQILLPIAVGMLARSRGWRWTAPVAVLAGAATAVNLADPGIAFTQNSWFYSVGLVAFPVLIGRYLRSGKGQGQEEPAPLLDLLLAGGGAAFAVLGTWPFWDVGKPPVWALGLTVMVAGFALGVVRKHPGAVLLLESVILVVADQYAPRTGNSLQLLALVALGVFATRASWSWVGAGYLLTCAVTAIVIVDGGTDITFVRVVTLMAIVTAPVAIGRYVRARQAEGRQARELSAERLRADRLAERERIARDVHDIVAHHVGAMVLRASAASTPGRPGPRPRRWPTSGRPATASWRTSAGSSPCSGTPNATSSRGQDPVTSAVTSRWPIPTTSCATPSPGWPRPVCGWTCASPPRPWRRRWSSGRPRPGSSRRG
jgi:hypothetical protein